MMRKTKSIPILLMVSLMWMSCKKDSPAPSCDETVVVNRDQYLSASKDPLVISSLEINEDCLKVTFSASGCDGDSWVVQLIDSEGVAESLPPQRSLILSLKNEEICAAVITKELTFDLSSIQVEGVSQVRLNITNTGDSILYEY